MALDLLRGLEVEPIATTIGNNLSKGLEALARNKMASMGRNQNRSRWQESGLSSELSHFLANQPEEVQAELFEKLNKPQQYQGEEPEEQDELSARQQKEFNNLAKEEAMIKKARENVDEKIEKSRAKAVKDRKFARHEDEFVKKVFHSGEVGEAETKAYSRLLDLTRNGKLDTPGYLMYLENAGFNPQAYLSPDTEEAKKIIATQVRNIKDSFSGNTTELQIKSFLDAIPNLLQSPEGRQRLTIQKLIEAQAKEVKSDVLKELLKEDRNMPHDKLLAELDTRSKKRIKALSGAWEKELKKPVPAPQNPIVQGAQAIAGTLRGNVPAAAVGAIGGGITGALKGGTVLGLPGAAVGAIGGGLAGLAGGHAVKNLIPGSKHH